MKKFGMNGIVVVALITGLVRSAMAQPQGQKAVPPTPITESKFFCKIEEFSSKKAVAKAFKRCNALVEGDDRPIKSAETCKAHGLDKGRECLKLSGAEQIQVKIKFTEQFGANRNFSSWTCELDNQGGSACP